MCRCVDSRADAEDDAPMRYEIVKAETTFFYRLIRYFKAQGAQVLRHGNNTAPRNSFTKYEDLRHEVRGFTPRYIRIYVAKYEGIRHGTRGFYFPLNIALAREKR